MSRVLRRWGAVGIQVDPDRLLYYSPALNQVFALQVALRHFIRPSGSSNSPALPCQVRTCRMAHHEICSGVLIVVRAAEAYV